MEIYVRTDLNMRKGKIGAQVSHAVMAIWLNKMDKHEDEFILNISDSTKLENWIKSPEIHISQVDSDEKLLKIKRDNKNTILITDQGRTEFKGVPTNTCLAHSDDNLNFSNISCLKDLSKDIVSKQVIIVNKDLNLNKWDVAMVSAISSVKSLFSQSIKENGRISIKLDNSNLKAWLTGSFAKIVVKASLEEIKLLKSEISKTNILYAEHLIGSDIASFAIGADSIENINKHTSEFKLY